MVDSRARQAELDAFARRKGWRRSRYRSWHANGWTIAVGSHGYPKRNFIASRKDRTQEFGSLDDLERLVAPRTRR